MKLISLCRLGCLLLTLALGCRTLDAFRPSLSAARSPNQSWEQLSTATLLASSKRDENESVEIGSKEYFQGLASRSVDEEPAERVTGDKVLGPTLRLAGGVAGVLVGLVLVFLISNGIVSL